MNAVGCLPSVGAERDTDERDVELDRRIKMTPSESSC
jgi:hypothetical protein